MPTITKQSKLICCIILPFLALVTLRYTLQAHIGDTYLIHNAIADSILEGNKWGLHALVKLLDVPLVPTLGLVAAKLVAVPLALNPLTLLTAVAQASIAFLLLATIRRHWLGRRDRFAMAALVILTAIPLFRNLILVNDPNWVSAIPLTCALRAVEDFRLKRTLNPLIEVAICLAIMVFCGPTMLLAATAILLILTKELDPRQVPGARCILWMPFLYAFLLWIPWTLNPQENFIFGFFHALAQAKATAFRLPFAWQPFTAAAVAALILAMKTKDNLTATCLLPLVLIAPAMAALTNAAQIASPATEAAMVTIIACLVINAFKQHDIAAKTPQIAALLALLLMCVSAIRHPQINFKTVTMPEIVLKEAYKPQPPPIDLFDSRDAPEPQTLIELADQQWKGSRIMVPGERLITKVYPDPQHKNFRPLPDFTPRTFKKLAQTECFHLIVPPNDGRFYGPKSHLARIHAMGAPYLFLVAQLDNDWQLWKSLPPKPHPFPQQNKQ